MPDHADHLQNDSRTCRPTGTRLTQASSRTVLEDARRDLIVMRDAHGADSPIGHRCSNIVELIQMRNPPRDLVQRQTADLARLRREFQ
jgi:hypothetical protein